MDELRPEIQEAFAKEQSKLGNVADSRERLVRGALAARNVHREGRTQLAAGVAAVVIAALVIATFAYVRNGIGPARHAPPVPASSPTPLSRDRKSTRLNSSHEWISYAVFCLKKKK